METTPLATALSTYLSDPANAKAMMQTLVAAACASSADNAGATALGGNYVHLLVDKSTGAVKFRSEADDAAVASGIGYFISTEESRHFQLTTSEGQEEIKSWYNGKPNNSIIFLIVSIGTQIHLWLGLKANAQYGAVYRIAYGTTSITRVFEVRGGVFYF